MQRWFLHMNCFGQAVDGRVNMSYTRILSIINRYLGETESLTVFDVDGLIGGFETSVHIRVVGEEHHVHDVGGAGFCRCFRLFSAEPEEETHTS